MAVLTLGSNISSLTAQRGLNGASSALQRSFERLSSGQRINHASDDAAGLAIASKLTSDARVFTQAIRNVNDGVGVANIAEGALNSLKDISTRQLELAEQAANGSYSLKQRRSLNTEANKLVEEFNRIVQSTTFNGMSLLDPNLSSVVIQAGIGSGGMLSMGVNDQLKRAIGDGTVGAQATWGNGGFSVQTGDFNNDGKVDFVTASSSSYTAQNLQVLLGNGDGTFKAAKTTTIETGGNAPTSLALADLNGDGKLDFVVTSQNTGRVQVGLGNGDGTFQPLTTVNTGISTISLGLGDFNLDGKIDFVASDGSSATKVYLGNGNGSFRFGSSQTVAIGYGHAAAEFSVSVGDFNGDGKQDFISSTGNYFASLFIGIGNGTFQSARSISTGSIYSDFVSSGDINRDGVLDLIASDVYGASAMLLGNADGTFKAGVILTGLGENTRVLDLNGDGNLDLIDGANFAFGNGDGTFLASRSTGFLTSAPGSTAFSDFNGDGRLDTVNYSAEVSLGNGGYATTEAFLNINTQQGARDALTTVTATFQRIESQLGSIGATTSRFQSALATLQVQRENFLAAAGRIQDADIASESANLVRNQILQQAAASVLAQANQEPALAIKLLNG